MTANEKAELVKELGHFTGTSAYHRVSGIPDAPIATDGVKYLAEKAECFWLLDIIASYQSNPKVRNSCLQVWEFKKTAETGATDRISGVVIGYDDVTPIVKQVIEYTDFPLDSIKIWCMAGGPQGLYVMLLPSEY